MVKSITIVKSTDEKLKNENVDIIFKEIQKDTVGRSGARPVWGMLYYNEGGKLTKSGIALFKGYDYDMPIASYSEKIWSIIGNKVLLETRVPKIDLVDEGNKEIGVISHRVLNNDQEDLIHIRDVLFNKFERDDFKIRQNVFYIEDLLECIKIQINDSINYEKVKTQVIHTLLLDAITNNGDRHGNNWGLVRDKETNTYHLADFDHSSSFVDLANKKPSHTCRGWVSSYIRTTPEVKKMMMGNCGDQIIDYISKNYKEDFNNFSQLFNQNLDDIIEEIKNENMNIDEKRLEKKLRERNQLLKKIRSREVFSYDI